MFQNDFKEPFCDILKKYSLRGKKEEGQSICNMLLWSVT
jgi:hypothetical protein